MEHVSPPETHSVHSNTGTSPRPSIHPSTRSSPILSSLSRPGPVSQSQTFTVHTCLPQTVFLFVKYQCICCPGDVPKTSCTIHTNHSFFLCFFFLFFFLIFFCVVSPSRSNSSIHDFVHLSQQTTFRAPFSKERSRRHWVSVWCKTACFGWNTLPPLCSGTVQPRDWLGDGGFIFPFAALVGRCSPCSRCASSCEEPDGQTWRSVWGDKGKEKEEESIAATQMKWTATGMNTIHASGNE